MTGEELGRFEKFDLKTTLFYQMRIISQSFNNHDLESMYNNTMLFSDLIAPYHDTKYDETCGPILKKAEQLHADIIIKKTRDKGKIQLIKCLRRINSEVAKLMDRNNLGFTRLGIVDLDAEGLSLWKSKESKKDHSKK